MKTNRLTEISLTPAQQRALDGLLEGLRVGSTVVLQGRPGAGKTTILENVHRAAGGVLLGARQFIDALSARHPDAIEEAFLGMIEDALAKHDLVIVDDLHLVTQIVESCSYPRAFLLDAALTAILADAAAFGKKLLFGVESDMPWPLRRRAYIWHIREFGPDDYASISRGLLAPDISGRLDFDRIHRFAPALNAHQLSNACNWLARDPQLDTERLLEYLRSQELTSNVDANEVERVEWSDLKGVDGVIRELEAKIALPFENDLLTAELGLKPKRGVLLAGPPGTGKTTIGRALAHRLKSKFFLIDGTVVAGSNDFYCKVGQIFAAAKRNAPAIVFIDDADVIFENEENRGFYRYLLTMLDGLESASAGRVCVMLTAMHAGSLPAAILRSGRVELWLETQLPDEPARAAILRERIAPLPAPIGSADILELAAASQGLTGADLRNVVEDAKLLFAHDRVNSASPRLPQDYFLEAIETVRVHRRKYAKSKPLVLEEPITVGFTVE